MKKYILFTALIAMVGLITACADYLYSDPAYQITEKQIIELNKKNVDAVLTPLAASIEAYPMRQVNTNVWQNSLKVLLVGMDYKGNDMIHMNAGDINNWLAKDYRMEKYRTSLPSDEHAAFWWGQMFGYVYKANQFLSLIPELESVTNPEIVVKLKTFKAIGLTLRAWGYTYLMWMFQDDYLNGGMDKAGVPLYLEPDVPNVGRGDAKDVWKQIITDATEAVRLFKEGGRNPKASFSDMDETVANIILARAAITMGDWNTVISAMDAVIGTYPTLMNETDYTTKGFGWLDVDEVIYGHDYDKATGGNASYHAFMSVLNNGGYGGSNQSHWPSIDQRLYDKIADNDYRKTNFLEEPIEHTYLGSSSPRTIPKYANMKYNAPAHTGLVNYEQGNIYIRTSEAILMKAEAQARSGQDAAAKTTLNVLLAARTKSGETPLTCDTYPSMAGMTALQMVQLQTRIELWGEGFEFYNNKRWNIPVNRNTPFSENHVVKIERPVKPEMTYQIPETELLYNKYITLNDQNP